MHLVKSYVALLLIISLSGCMSLPAIDANDPIDLSHEYIAQSDVEVTGAYDLKWWEMFEDEELNLLMDHAFLNNPNINKISARLEQAKASAAKSFAPRLPNINASGSYDTSRGDNAPSSDYTLNGAASFEIDLWGKNRATYKSADLQRQASAQDLYAAAITLSASIAENWLNIISLMEQQTLINKQIDVNKTVLTLQRKRFEMGSSSALDVLQQQEILAKSEATLPDIISAQKQAANNIAALIGETPYNSLKITERPLPLALPIPMAGLPSDLLANRPDIIAAWLRLGAADWAVKAAWADRLPAFDLSAAYLTSAGKLDGLFNSWLLNMVAGIATPIFDGGSRKAEQRRNEALSDERYHAYKGVVLAAVTEVENSLIRNKYQDIKLNALAKQLTASKSTLDQAQLSYINGKSSYINVLSSLNNLQALEQQITNERLVQAKERVGLYRALGGKSWVKLINKSDESI